MPTPQRRAEALLDSPLVALLLPAWLVYRPLVYLRNLLYDKSLIRSARAGPAVISIGNLAVGGTGKTPTAAYLAERLRALGRHPAVLSRGYRGHGGRNDEAELLPCPVFCHRRRAQAARAAVAAGADCLVLDDGFQHRALHRDLDLVLIDASRPWGRGDGGRGRTLPLGYLRERPSALRRAGAVLLTRCDQADPARVTALRRGLARYGIPVLRSRHAPRLLRRIGGADQEEAAPQWLHGRPVLLASGLGNPDAFERSARELGWSVGDHRRFGDHHRYSDEDARDLAQAARSRHAELVVSSKDAVKLAPLLERLGAGAWCLEIALELPEDDAAALDALLMAALCTRTST